MLDKLRDLGIFILSIILVYLFFRYLGWKGGLGMLIGMFLMAYLLISKNLAINFLVERIEQEIRIARRR